MVKTLLKSVRQYKRAVSYTHLDVYKRQSVDTIAASGTRDQVLSAEDLAHLLDRLHLPLVKGPEVFHETHIFLHLLQTAHSGKDHHDTRKSRRVTDRVGSRTAAVKLLKDCLRIIRKIRKTSAADRFHNDHLFSMLSADLIAFPGLNCRIIKICIVKLDLDDFDLRDVYKRQVYEVPVSDQLFVIQSKIIQRLAANGPCVIIGRCSDVIVEDAFRIFICSSFKKRVERIQGLEKEPEDLKKLESRIRAVDAKRRDYYQYYSGNEWGKPKNYDLCLNSGTLGIDVYKRQPLRQQRPA